LEIRLRDQLGTGLSWAVAFMQGLLLLVLVSGFLAPGPNFRTAPALATVHLAGSSGHHAATTAVDAHGAGTASSSPPGATWSPGSPDIQGATAGVTGHPRLSGHLGVAAEDVGGGVVRHYTTDSAAQSISKEGVLRPGASGKTYLTPDEYASGAEARARLALNKTPDGYYEIPMCRVQCASGPSPVKPFYHQPGGGTEITTEFPIDISGLDFFPFGGG